MKFVYRISLTISLVFMEKKFIKQLYKAHREATKIPSPGLVCSWLDGLLELLFPELADRRYRSEAELERDFLSMRLQLLDILESFDMNQDLNPTAIAEEFLEELPHIREVLMMDANAIWSGDPAAVSLTEVIRTYPGFFAIAVHRLAHVFCRLGVPLMPRILSEHAHSKTGVDIHPSASIGERFCIDHGTGLVIGETVKIGNDVKMYQGVTLGALSVKKEMAQTKRHPTIEDRVVIYAGATILGGETVVGHDSIIGGSVWLTKSVPPHSVLYYKGLVKRQERPVPE